MKQVILGGNWKAHGSDQALKKVANMAPESFMQITAFLAVPNIFIQQAVQIFPKTLTVGAEDVSMHGEGSHTGETTAAMLKSSGVTHAIIGHSERRIQFKESNLCINKKLQQCLEHGIRPVLCVGESDMQRKHNAHLNFLKAQLDSSVGHLSNVSLDIAYEPVWAIGGLESASCNEIEEVSAFINDWMESRNITGGILYGGSVSVSNAAAIMQSKHINGVLVGAAALDEEFEEIAKILQETVRL